MSCRNLNFDLSDRSFDTLTSVNKPVKTSKEWLISIVRILSRVYIEKGKGQDGVWSENCKPEWWDREVGLQWRNPTGKSKDTVDDLKKKYEALARKLREERRFPSEFDDEARLWDVGKVDELFQLVSEKNLYESLKNSTCACTSYIDKYGLDQINPTIRNKILIEITNLQRCFKVQSNINQLTSGIDTEADNVKSTKKSYSLKKTKNYGSKKMGHTSVDSIQSLDQQAEFTPSSSHQANNIFQKSSKSYQSAYISGKQGSVVCENVLDVCPSKNSSKKSLLAIESSVKRKRGNGYPDIGSFRHEDLVNVKITELYNDVENNFAERNEEEMIRKRKASSNSVNVIHCKKLCESSLRDETSHSSKLNVDGSSKFDQTSFFNLAKQNEEREELNIIIEESKKIFKSKFIEDHLLTPTQLSTDECTEDPLLEKISETFRTSEEQDSLFAGNSQDVADLFLKLPDVEPSHDLRYFDDA
ncbi:uncharacterized protein LOC131952521 isoform X1 [Physella acuta]|uniref:uncharacterized protein LOC131952521 isoform X1 n=1 Tax=Physella acuta TaxID=109671 RepID=UPI0027DBE172|nr:uncharacterized protein LOC131952521 isoform X1 [Physella acuta]